MFHVSLSLGPDEGTLSDEQWADIAGEYVDAMEFAGPKTTAAGRAECQWVAVHHGTSKGGGDHIHIAVCLVREDSTRASVHQSHRRSRAATDAIEARHGLRPVKDRPPERGLPGYTKAEGQRAEREGLGEVGKLQIARRLRAAAAVSGSEAQFVDSARLAGVMVRPRFASATTDRVVGYSAALRPRPGQAVIWYAPSKLDRNLGLGQLRSRWGVDRTGGDEAGAAAVATWRATKNQQSTAGSKWSSMRALPPETAAQLSALTRQLSKVDLTDRAGWQAAAREASHVFARWSVQVEGERPGPLARASDALARSAQPDKDQRDTSPYPGLGARHVGLMVRATSKSPVVGWLSVMTQLDRLTQSIQDAHEARAELVAAHRIGHGTGTDLVATRAALVAASQTTTGTAEAGADDGHAAAQQTTTQGTAEPKECTGASPPETGEPSEQAARGAALHFPESVGEQLHRAQTRRPPATAPPRRDRQRDRDRERDREHEA